MHRRPAVVLFLCLFASQASFLTLAPILPDVARDFGVEVGTAGQLRAISGVAGALVALAAGGLARRVRAREQLLAGTALLGAGSLGSAAAPSFVALAAAQVAIGAGVAVCVTSGIAAAAEWAPPGGRPRMLAWALLGQPAAWVLGMPLTGVVASLGWRWTWIALPFGASMLALLAVRAVRMTPGPLPKATAGAPVWRRPAVMTWAAGETLAYAGWAGTLVFGGALFVESYGVSATATGAILGAAALGYFPGTLIARRHVEPVRRRSLIVLALGCAATVGTFELVRPVWWLSAAVLALAMACAGARTIAGSAFGLDAAPDQRAATMGIRTAALQVGYLLGAALGGAALAVGGYSALGALLTLLFVLAALPHAVARGKVSGRSAADHRRPTLALAPAAPQVAPMSTTGGTS